MGMEIETRFEMGETLVCMEGVSRSDRGSSLDADTCLGVWWATQGVRNEPATVPLGVKAIAKVKGMTEEEAAGAIRENFRRLFGR